VTKNGYNGKFSVTNQLRDAIKYLGKKFGNDSDLKVLVPAVNKKFLNNNEFDRLFQIGTNGRFLK
jgi:hypothetical protein